MRDASGILSSESTGGVSIIAAPLPHVMSQVLARAVYSYVQQGRRSLLQIATFSECRSRPMRVPATTDTEYEAPRRPAPTQAWAFCMTLYSKAAAVAAVTLRARPPTAAGGLVRG
jgi:hypothetical protein